MNLPPGSFKHVGIGEVVSNMTASQLNYKYQLFAYPYLLVRKIN